MCYDDGVLFKDLIYTQAVGAPTGHPISSCAQNVVMTAFEYDIIQPLLHNKTITLYERWVDDTLLRTHTKHITHIHTQFETFHNNLKFTVERATEVNKYGQTVRMLPSLDFSINWNANTSYTEVYQKNTTSKIVMPYTDYGPLDWKEGTLIGFIRRAITHSSTRKLMHTQIESITERFLLVGYPKWLIHNKINQTVTRVLYPEHAPKKQQPPTTEKQRWVVLHLPWAGNEANEIVRRMRRTLPREHARISIAYTTTKLRTLLPSFTTCAPPEGNTRQLLANNIVYKYDCHCGRVYIGETMRRFSVRIEEHANKTSPLSEHIAVCEACDDPGGGRTIDRARFSIIAKRLRGREARKRYESIYIRYFNKRALNICTSSRDLVIF